MSLTVGLMLAIELAFSVITVVHPRCKCWHAVHDISRGALLHPASAARDLSSLPFQARSRSGM